MREVNFTEQQAEFMVELIEQQSHIIQGYGNKLEQLESKELATKGDLRETELRLQKEIEVVRRDIIQVKSDLVKWVIETGVATILAMASLLKFMIH